MKDSHNFIHFGSQLNRLLFSFLSSLPFFVERWIMLFNRQTYNPRTTLFPFLFVCGYLISHRFIIAYETISLWFWNSEMFSGHCSVWVSYIKKNWNNQFHYFVFLCFIFCIHEAVFNFICALFTLFFQYSFHSLIKFSFCYIFCFVNIFLLKCSLKWTARKSKKNLWNLHLSWMELKVSNWT